MRRTLEKTADEDGKSSCSRSTRPTSRAPTGAAHGIKACVGEIARPAERSSIADHEARIRGLTGLTGLTGPSGPSRGTVIAKFSAHNTIARSSSAPAALSAPMLSSSGSTHTTFNLKWATGCGGYEATELESARRVGRGRERAPVRHSARVLVTDGLLVKHRRSAANRR